VIIVDMGGVYALADRHDTHHRPACAPGRRTPAFDRAAARHSGKALSAAQACWSFALLPDLL
jgi:hypothetical protein